MTGHNLSFSDDPASRGLRMEGRDSLFVLAQIRVAGGVNAQSVRVRNLSPSGLMAEGGVSYAVGTAVIVEMRNVSPVKGRIVWSLDGRMGVALDATIDPVLVRQTIATATHKQPHGTNRILARRPGLKQR
jgi:hypothetical protein